MKEEMETVNGVEVPSRERIAAAEAVIKELWDCGDKLGRKPHIMLSVGYMGEISWSIYGLDLEGRDESDPVEMLRKAYPSEEEKERVERERKQAELLECENRANELRKELSELCEK